MFNLKGDTVASCDADGIVKLWDVRVVSEFLQIDTGRHPANAANFDRSGKVLAIACLSSISAFCGNEVESTCFFLFKDVLAVSGLVMHLSRPSTSKIKSLWPTWKGMTTQSRLVADGFWDVGTRTQ